MIFFIDFYKRKRKVKETFRKIIGYYFQMHSNIYKMYILVHFKLSLIYNYILRINCFFIKLYNDQFSSNCESYLKDSIDQFFKIVREL